MKLGKNEIMAIVESALFLFGAIFMAIVFIVPSNPLWAFIIGLILALSGVGLWVGWWAIPLLRAKVKKAVDEKRAATLTATTVEEATAVDKTYELHRPVHHNQPNGTTPATTPTATEQPTTANDQPTADNKPTLDLDF